MFGQPDTFMEMVRQGYRPVYRPQTFDSARSSTRRPVAQKVHVVGPDGRPVTPSIR